MRVQSLCFEGTDIASRERTGRRMKWMTRQTVALGHQAIQFCNTGGRHKGKTGVVIQWTVQQRGFAVLLQVEVGEELVKYVLIAGHGLLFRLTAC